MIRQDATEAEDSVEAFEDLSGVDDERTVLAHVYGHMGECVELCFVDDAIWIDQGPNIQDVGYQNLKICLHITMILVSNAISLVVNPIESHAPHTDPCLACLHTRPALLVHLSPSINPVCEYLNRTALRKSEMP